MKLIRISAICPCFWPQKSSKFCPSLLIFLSFFNHLAPGRKSPAPVTEIFCGALQSCSRAPPLTCIRFSYSPVRERGKHLNFPKFSVGKTALEGEEIYQVSVQEWCKKQEWILHYLRPSSLAQPEDYFHPRIHIHTLDPRCQLTRHNIMGLGIPAEGKIPQEYPLGSTMSGRSTAVPSSSHMGGFAGMAWPPAE